ncbi:MAG: glucosaminidase domain-containing protein [Ktedonobacteraceae bacterium]|nr:glucosaminidase domain-containing protein [Ktedonobacteraceae bacterium]
MRCLVRVVLLLLIFGLGAWMVIDLVHGSHRGPVLSFTLPGPSSASASSLSSSSTGTSILGRPSLSASFIENVLTLAHSPAQGTGQTFYTESLHTGIDDAFPFAFFLHESSLGRAGAATATRNPGNITCAHVPPCLGNFRLYPTWAAGVQALYHLLAHEYIPFHRSTLETILPVYAPSSDGNDPLAYIAAVKASVVLWHQEAGK